MKKWIVLLLSLVIVISLCACENQDSSNRNTSSIKSSSPSTYATEKDELSDTEIESIVANALYNKIDSYYDTADAGSCRYDINKTEEKNGYIYAYGSVTLYDKYGKITGGWADGSGTAFRSFTVKINADTGLVSNCDID